MDYLYFEYSPVEFLPVLGSVGDGNIFIIALYKGIEKPASCAADTFLRDFVDEIVPYCLDGIEIHTKIYKFEFFFSGRCSSKKLHFQDEIAYWVSQLPEMHSPMY